ncbi:MAG: serine-rich protein, partial [Chloroflexi bacterium]|nr:serine-rich protein [Chloroflexota bacterium]
MNLLKNAHRRVQGLLHGTNPVTRPDQHLTPHDLEIRTIEQVYHGVMLDHIHYVLVEHEAGQTYHYHKVVRLLQARFLPREMREQYGVLERMRKVLRGLYQAQVEIVVIYAGIFEPYTGVVQIYGVQTVADDYETAQVQSAMDIVALEAALRGIYAQSEFVPMPTNVAEWLRQAFQSMPYAGVAIGQPDPRENPRGMDSDSVMSQTVEEATMQQNEILMRGMAARREEFVCVVMGSPVPIHEIVRLQRATAHEGGRWASLERGSQGLNVGVSLPVIFSGMVSDGVATSASGQRGHTEGQSQTTGETVGHTDGYTHGQTVGEAHSVGHTQGTTVTDSHGQTVTTGEVQGTGTADGTSHTTGHTDGVADGVSHTDSVAQTKGKSWSESTAVSTGTGTTSGWNQSAGSGTSTGHAASTGWNQGSSTPAQTVTHTETGPVASASDVAAAMQGSSGGLRDPHAPPSIPTAADVGHVSLSGGFQPAPAADPLASGVGVSSSLPGQTVSQSQSQSAHLGGSLGVVGTGVNAGVGGAEGHGVSTPVAPTQSYNIPAATAGVSRSVPITSAQSFGTSGGETVSAGQNASQSAGVSGATSASSGVTATSSRGGMSSTTHGTADSTSHVVSQSDSVADGVSHVASQSQARSSGLGLSRSHSVSQSSSVSETMTQSRSESQAWSSSDSVARSEAQGQTIADSIGLAQARSLVTGRGMGMGVGVSPSISASKTYQWEDHVATMVADILRVQELLLATGAGEGMYLIDAYMLTRDQRGQRAVETLWNESFHGTEEVATPAQVRRLTDAEVAYISLHAQALTPTTRRQYLPGVWERYRDASMLTLLQTAALTAPGVFEAGPALTVQPRIPPYALIPDLPGEVVVGYQVDHETGDTTGAALRLTRERMTNCAFFADTRFGKSVAAEWLAKEVHQQWDTRVVALDFGLGWRKLQHLIAQDRYDFYSLYPGGPRPIRWNPLQIGTRIPAEIQMMATVDLLCNAGRMGERQSGWLRTALRELYLENGVLTDDPEVLWPDEHNLTVKDKPDSDLAKHLRAWSWVQDGERPALDAERQRRGYGPVPARLVYLHELTEWEKQLVAIQRSQQVDLSLLYDRIKQYQGRMGRGSQTDYAALEGIIKRLFTFRYGAMAQLYGRGAGSVALENLGWTADGRPGVVVLEGGATEM